MKSHHDWCVFCAVSPDMPGFCLHERLLELGQSESEFYGDDADGDDKTC